MPILMPTIKYLTSEQVAKVISAAGSLRNRALLALVYNCGLRRGEVQYMVRDHFHPTTGPNGMVQVPRLKKVELEWHEILLWKRTAKLLRLYMLKRKDYHPALFLSRKKVPMTGQAVYYVFRKAAKRAGIPDALCSPKAFRHSIAVHYMNQGVDPVDLQNLLGHSHISTTLQYGKVLTPRKTRMVLSSEASYHFAKF